MNNYEDEFPPLNITCGWDSKIKTLWFNLSRKSDLCEIRELFVSVLEISRLDIVKQNVIKRLILHTRDIGSGKGEQLLSYMMLFEYYRLFPDEAFLLLELFVTKYGSWRDIPYLCDYISKTSSRDHEFIHKAVTMMNDHLYLDMKKTENNEPISTVAKWVPREGSKFTWLFDLLLENWTLRHHSYLFRTAKSPEQRVKARCKAAAIYRKVFTELSSKLNLVETKLCKGIEFVDIDPLVINKKTMSKQWHPSYDMDFRSDFYNRPNYHDSKPKTFIHSNYPVSWLVDTSIKLPFLPQNDNINSLWRIMMSDKDFGPFIPMIDISSSVDKTGNIHSIIGNALIVAKHSTIMDSGIRMIFLGNEPLWYNGGELLDDDSVQLLKDISKFLPHFSISNIFEGMTYLLESILSSNMNPEEVSKIHLVVFTDRGFNSMSHHEIESLFHNKGLGIPRFIYWNISDKYVNLEDGIFMKEPFFLSGNDPSNFDALFQISKSNTCFSQLELIHLILSKYVVS
jgi:hypothetical protein